MSDISSMKKQLPKHDSPDPGVKVIEMGRCTRSAWDLFILFGADRMDEFKSLAIKTKDKGLNSGYIMLIGASRIEGDKIAFEDIAVDYAVQFGQSPPAWFEGHTRQQNTEPSSIEIQISNFSADTLIETTVKMESPRPLILNMASVTKVDAHGIDLFNEALSSRFSRGEKTRITNCAKLADDLVEKLILVQGKPHPGLWDFCLNLFRLTNAQQRFNQVAQAYVRLGGPVPAWKDLSDPEEVTKVAKTSENYQAGSRLKDMTPESVKVFLATAAGAAARQAGMVFVDMSNTSAGSLTDAMAVVHLIQAFKDQKIRVSMINVNEIFGAMFHSLAINNLVESLAAPGAFS